jgi:protein subunit release factor B
MPVSSEKERAIAARMMELGVTENDFEESFIRSSGPGGQKVNKSSSCVYLVHIPTGLSVKCQRERSQSLNRYLARKLLLDKIERVQKGFIAKEKEKLEKIRRQKRKRSKRAKEKILISKHQQSEKKVLRGKVVVGEE